MTTELWNQLFPEERKPIFPDLIKPEDIDEGMYEIVSSINKSGWLWTIASCSKHIWRIPYVCVICKSSDRNRLLQSIGDAIDFFSDGKITLARNYLDSDEWCCYQLFFDANCIEATKNEDELEDHECSLLEYYRKTIMKVFAECIKNDMEK